MGGVLAWLVSWHGWRASVGSVGGVGGMLLLFLLLLLKYYPEKKNLNVYF